MIFENVDRQMSMLRYFVEQKRDLDAQITRVQSLRYQKKKRF